MITRKEVLEKFTIAEMDNILTLESVKLLLELLDENKKKEFEVRFYKEPKSSHQAVEDGLMDESDFINQKETQF